MIGGVVEKATRKGKVLGSNPIGREARDFTRKKRDLRLRRRRAGRFPIIKFFSIFKSQFLLPWAPHRDLTLSSQLSPVPAHSHSLPVASIARAFPHSGRRHREVILDASTTGSMASQRATTAGPMASLRPHRRPKVFRSVAAARAPRRPHHLCP